MFGCFEHLLACTGKGWSTALLLLAETWGVVGCIGYLLACSGKGQSTFSWGVVDCGSDQCGWTSG